MVREFNSEQKPGAAGGADAAPTHISPHVAENIGHVLSAIRNLLGMDIAFVAEFLGSNRIFHNVDTLRRDAPLAAGDRFPMSAGYCDHIVAGRLPELIPDTRSVPFALTIPETAALPIGAHLSVPIRIGNGRTFGTFCCLSHEPRPQLDVRDLELMRTFGRMIANEIGADLHADIERRRVIERLQGAIGNGDPRMVFQPIYRLGDLSLAGVEALSRFSADPKRTPDLWFADAHRVGLGGALELLAVRKALDECAALPAPLSVNVNISPDTLVLPETAAALSGFDPERIVIEITEHVPIDDYDPIVAALAPLRAAGMRVAIDDAGAGYSSLRHVLTLRPDIIKFDTSLTRGINVDPMRKAMVAALSEFAQRTGTHVVAEGVETDEELATLRELKVEKAQGYRFSRPQPMADLLVEIARRQLDPLRAKPGAGRGKMVA
jgi:EAL domain-containing protein (putative c-di-GMP-specific phosphodiesterase class I)